VFVSATTWHAEVHTANLYVEMTNERKTHSPLRDFVHVRYWPDWTASHVWWNSFHRPTAIVPLVPCSPALMPAKRNKTNNYSMNGYYCN